MKRTKIALAREKELLHCWEEEGIIEFDNVAALAIGQQTLTVNANVAVFVLVCALHVSFDKLPKLDGIA